MDLRRALANTNAHAAYAFPMYKCLIPVKFITLLLFVSHFIVILKFLVVYTLLRFIIFVYSIEYAVLYHTSYVYSCFLLRTGPYSAYVHVFHLFEDASETTKAFPEGQAIQEAPLQV